MPELVSRPDYEWSVMVPCKGGCRYVYRYFARDLWVGWFSVPHPRKRDKVRVSRYYVKCGNCEKIHFVSPPDNVKSQASPG